MNFRNNSRLAINGGAPVRSKPWIDNFTTGHEEQEAACRAIQTGYLSKFEGSFKADPPFSFYGGPFVQKLEALWSEYYQVGFSVSMNSATSGLYAALGALEIGYGDEVIVSPATMTACAIGPLIYGAIPIFADLEIKTGCLDPNSIERLLTPRTKCILVVHQSGIPADMDPIMAIAKKHNIRVIEDCAQAHGAKYKDQYVGTIGDIGVFSLNVNKTIQSGEGAVCTTNSEELRYRLALIRNHGEAVVGPANYTNIVNILGYNYRMTEVGAAIAIEQLKKLNSLNEIRLDLVEYLNSKLKQFEFLEICEGRKDCVSTFYQLPLLYKETVTEIPMADFRKAVNAEGVYFFPGPGPLYLQPVYQTKTLFKHGYPFSAPENREIKTNYQLGACPQAEFLIERGRILNEHIRPPHTRADMDDIVEIFNKIESCIK